MSGAMSGVVMKTIDHSEAVRLKIKGPLIALTAALLLSGCTFAKRDSVIVGSVPDDYRTNHPIVVSESSEQIDLPVGASIRKMSRDQAATLAGFLDGYDRRSGGTVTMLVPAGSANELAASSVASDFSRLMQARGVPAERIAILAYQSPAPDVSPPIRVSYPVVKASTGPCGRWPKDALDTTDNKHYANFGCSYQNNLAAQVANPNDFLGPRKQTPIHADRSDAAISDYTGRKVSDGFKSNREVTYD
ncbi:pilus assembly protein CpaD [Nitratireductor indicus]|nr:pilus assembly protein CpaD [Nitratireductor indicus]